MSGSLSSLTALEGKVALVAGGGGAIGSSIAERLLQAGAIVVCIDREGRTGPIGTVALEADLARQEAIEGAVDRVRAEQGRLDILVHAAGITRDGLLWKLSGQDWRQVLATNLDSAFYLLHGAVPLLRAAGGGAVLLISSINGDRGKVGQANYAASKAGLHALARTAARELGRFNIRVNALAPGWVETPMTAALAAEFRQRAVDESALGRVATADDIACAALFLCTDMSRHVTGQVLRVDGGQLIG